jgi:hypothetical protein
VVWTTDPPPEPSPLSAGAASDGLGGALGSPVPDGRHWRLLCPATPPPTDGPVWLKACRLGYRDSAEVHLLPRAARAEGAIG